MMSRQVQDFTWTIPRIWEGKNVFIIGGGRSINSQRELIKSLFIKGPILAINNAWELEQYADMLYFADRQWYQWNKEELGWFKGKYIVTRSYIPDRDGGPRVKDVKVLGKDWGSHLSENPSKVAGWCSGSNAINIAYLAGAKAAYLFGFDMQLGRWHEKHQAKDDDYYERRFIPSINCMAKQLVGKMEVYNATPNSRLECFPFVTEEDIAAL